MTTKLIFKKLNRKLFFLVLPCLLSGPVFFTPNSYADLSDFNPASTNPEIERIYRESATRLARQQKKIQNELREELAKEEQARKEKEQREKEAKIARELELVKQEKEKEKQTRINLSKKLNQQRFGAEHLQLIYNNSVQFLNIDDSISNIVLSKNRFGITVSNDLNFYRNKHQDTHQYFNLGGFYSSNEYYHNRFTFYLHSIELPLDQEEENAYQKSLFSFLLSNYYIDYLFKVGKIKNHKLDHNVPLNISGNQEKVRLHRNISLDAYEHLLGFTLLTKKNLLVKPYLVIRTLASLEDLNDIERHFKLEEYQLNEKHEAELTQIGLGVSFTNEFLFRVIDGKFNLNLKYLYGSASIPYINNSTKYNHFLNTTSTADNNLTSNNLECSFGVTLNFSKNIFLSSNLVFVNSREVDNYVNHYKNINLNFRVIITV